jgi:hypothetical protein
MRFVPLVLLFVIASFADVTKTICSSGADYATPSAFEAAYTTNLAGLGVVNGNHCAENFDVTGLVISGQTNASATDYLSFNGSGIRATTFTATSGTYGVNISTSNINFVNLNMRSTGATVFLVAARASIILNRCSIRQQTNGGAALSVETAGSNGLFLYSSAIMCSGTGTTYGLYTLDAANVATIYNTVITGCAQGYTSFNAATVTTVKNTAFNVATAFTGTSVYTVDYNACKNTGCNGSNSLNSVAVGNFPSDSININTASTLYGRGVSLSGTFTQDVNSKTWGVWSIGANDPTATNGRCGVLWRMGMSPRGR